MNYALMGRDCEGGWVVGELKKEGVMSVIIVL